MSLKTEGFFYVLESAMLKVLHSRGDINVGISGGGGDLNLKRHMRELKALCVMQGKNTLILNTFV